jgi:hypothetical protein
LYKSHLLDGIVSSKVVHHVTFGAEALAAFLGAVEWPVIIVYAHMYRQIVPVVEGLLAVWLRADKIGPRLMVCKVCLEILTGLELLRASPKSAFEDLGDLDRLALLAL